MFSFKQTPGYNWNAANVGVKHKSINQSFKQNCCVSIFPHTMTIISCSRLELKVFWTCHPDDSSLKQHSVRPCKNEHGQSSLG